MQKCDDSLTEVLRRQTNYAGIGKAWHFNGSKKSHIRKVLPNELKWILEDYVAMSQIGRAHV